MNPSFPPVPDPPLPSAALLRALAAHPDLMADLITALNIAVPDADALVELMGRAARQAVQILDGVDFAGVTAEFDGQGPFTAAHTDQTVLIVDERQYQVHDGPCLHAMRTNHRTHMTLAQVATAWPHLAQAAAAVGVRSFLALPLHAAPGDTAVGSLNLYSAALDALTAPDEDLLIVLTEYLDRGLHSYRQHQTRFGTADLKAALARRALIDQAVGVLMTTEHLDSQQAHDHLQESSRTAQRTPAEQARYILARHLPPAGSPDL